MAMRTSIKLKSKLFWGIECFLSLLSPLLHHRQECSALVFCQKRVHSRVVRQHFIYAGLSQKLRKSFRVVDKSPYGRTLAFFICDVPWNSFYRLMIISRKCCLDEGAILIRHRTTPTTQTLVRSTTIAPENTWKSGVSSHIRLYVDRPFCWISQLL